ncbi:hypothetical protein FE257_011595 [Aspergillus nanangensis]|uniref:Uncharacterized protein n=1 Tax=Aspergillus nanangensis TaxID=2582783 RepID=A0AAD4CH20_ASPNN|nr:hypothetical protein FE257_011595 [Aspergillus nanangensis]
MSLSKAPDRPKDTGSGVLVSFQGECFTISYSEFITELETYVRPIICSAFVPHTKDSGLFDRAAHTTPSLLVIAFRHTPPLEPPEPRANPVEHLAVYAHPADSPDMPTSRLKQANAKLNTSNNWGNKGSRSPDPLRFEAIIELVNANNYPAYGVVRGY